MADRADRIPPSADDMKAMFGENKADQARKALPRKGTAPIHGHVNLEESMRQERQQALKRSQAMGNNPRGVPLGDFIGRKPKRPDDVR